MGKARRIFAVDPGSKFVGWAVLDPGDRLVAAGAIEAKGRLFVRLGVIFRAFGRLLKEHANPADEVDVVFERAVLFGHKGDRGGGSIPSIEARGALLAALSEHGVDRFFEYNASQMKKAVTGKGNAEKAVVRAQILREYPAFVDEAVSWPLDVTDAIGLGICHSVRARVSAECWA